jgi:hypothetical protein
MLLVSMLAACGHHSAVAADAARDGSGDAPTSDAPSGDATVTVQFNGKPVSGVRLIFSSLTMEYAERFTDVTGSATASIAPGAFVTAIDPFPQPPSLIGASNLFTIAGVKPGDHLVMSQHARTPTLGLSFPITTATVPNATAYVMNCDCANASLTAGMGMVIYDKFCTTSDIFFSAIDGSGTVLATLFHQQLAGSQGVAVDLSSEPFVTSTSTAFTYSNLPSPSTANIQYRVLSARPGIMTRVVGSAAITGGNGTATVQLPGITAPLYGVLDTSFASGSTAFDVVEWGLVSTGTYTLDPTGILPPAFATAPSFDIPSRTLSWTPAATGATPDFVFGALTFNRDDHFTWSFAAPYNGGTFTLPALDGFRLATDDTTQISLQSVIAPGGYDTVRPFVFAAGHLSQMFVADGTIGRTVSAQTFVSAM